MYKHILLPTDGSALSEKALKEGIALAKALGARVTGLYVMRPWDPEYIDLIGPGNIDVEDWPELSTKMAERYLSVGEKFAQAAGVPYASVYVAADEAYEGIIETAKNKSCDLIFMASHGRKGIRSLLVGSETAKVLTHTTIPILVSR